MKKVLRIFFIVIELVALIGLMVLSTVTDRQNNNELNELQSRYRESQNAEAEQKKLQEQEEKQKEYNRRVEEIYESKYLLDENDGRIVIDSSNAEIAITDNNEMVFDVTGYDGIKCLAISGWSNDISEKIEINAMLNDEVIESASFCINSKEERAFYFPSVDADSFIVKDADRILVDSIYVYILPLETEMSVVKAGTYTSNQVDNVYLEKSMSEPAVRAVVNDGNYVFSNSNGSIIAWETGADDSLQKVSQIDHVCSNIWKLELDANRNILVAACRSDGVYIIDYSDINDMKVVSHYDTYELATDISIDNNYIAIASRYFGVELIDISDISNPVFVSNPWVAYEEFESCIMNGRYLYVGVWAQKKVEIFDLATITEPVLVSTIELDGKAYYMDVKDDILYVATGQHASSYNSEIADIGYGTGNGIEIYDVSSPEAPVWRSSAKAKGRWFGGKYDTWGVEVAGKYAYFFNAYNGVYIYDISDVDNPKLCTEVNTPVINGDPRFEPLNSVDFVFNNDRGKWLNAPILDITVSNGVVYLASPQTGIYSYRYENAVYENREQKKYRYEESKVDIVDENVVYPLIEDNLWAVATVDEYVFLACDKGIKVLDKTYKLRSFYETDSSVFDIKTYNDLLVTAEGCSGIGIYKTSGSEIEKVNQIDLPNKLRAKTINISNGHVVVQTEVNKVVLVNISDLDNIQIVGTSSAIAGNMYYRELAQGSTDNSTFYYKGLNGIVCLSIENGNIREKLIDNTVLAEHCGVCVTNDYLYSSTSKKIIRISLDGKYQRKEFPIVSDNYALYGKLQILGKYLVCVEEISKDLTVYEIKEKTGDLVYKKTVRFSEGFPDLGCLDNNGNILIPLKRIGLVKIDMY